MRDPGSYVPKCMDDMFFLKRKTIIKPIYFRRSSITGREEKDTFLHKYS